MTRRFNFLPALLAIAFVACNEEFTPKGKFEPTLVVYGILGGDRDIQFVRVSSTYNTVGFDPKENSEDPQITDAVVTLSSAGSTIMLRDTLLLRRDSSRYKSLIHAYYVSGMRPTPNTRYQLSVNTATRGSATGSVLVPDHGIPTVTNPFIFTRPLNFPNTDIFIGLVLANDARGYVVRLFVDYEIIPGQFRRIEVPMRIDWTTGEPVPVYPSVRRGVTESSPSLSISHQITRDAYVYALYQAELGYSRTTLRFRQAVIVLYSIDKNLYSYYNIANGFQDPSSIRTDQPDFTNIRGGVGVFGAYSVDSVTVDLENRWIDIFSARAKME
jgi:hypothetical protein